MRKFLLLLAAMLGLGATHATAAMFTPSPAPLQEKSQNVVITFNALESGVDGLKGLSTDLYAHIGVYTNKSPNAWSHTSSWGDNDAKYLLKRTAANTYQITLGDLRTYFGITDASENITSICIIARTADKNVQTSDQFIKVYPNEGLYMDFSTTPASTVIKAATDITFTAQTTEAATIRIKVDGVTKKEVANTTKVEYTQNFATAGGSWDVVAEAVKGTTTISQSANVIYVTPSPDQNYPGGTPKQGAVRNSDGTVTFCLAAPGKSNVMLVGSWDNYKVLPSNTMKHQKYNGYDYFWITVSGLNNTDYYPYYYLVDGVYAVGDPYAHLVLDYASDKWFKNLDEVFPGCPEYPYSQLDGIMLGVYKGDIDNYDWKVKNYKINNVHSLVIYELLLRDFTGTDNNADGTIRQAIEKIPYLKDLGVTAVELLPIMQFDGNNSWGYNTNFYMAPDKSYGSPDDYKEFIDLCHQNGIAVILDIVLNHTPGLAPWYAMYDEGTSPFYNKTAPHDYGVYNDIKQDYPLVEAHWKDVLTYWLTQYKVDGFRFDLVKGLGDSNSYGSGTEAYNQSRIDRMKRLHAHILSVNPNAIHINENLAGPSEETPMGNDGQLNWNNQNGTAITYVRGQAGGNFKYFLSSNCSRPNYSTVDYCESHDEQRLGYAITKAGGNNTSTNSINSSLMRQSPRLAQAGVMMMMYPGPKMIWMFGEFGDDQALTSSGRTDAKKLTWSYINNVQRSKIYNTYREMVNLRRNNPDMFSDGVELYDNAQSNISTTRQIRLTRGNREIVAVINPTLNTEQANVIVNTNKMNASNYQVISGCSNSSADAPAVTASGSQIKVTLPAGGHIVLATKDIAGVDEVIADGIESSSVAVYGGQGEIVIAGEYNNVQVYNVAGQYIGRLNGLEAGIYIVNVDGQTTKVAVK